MPGFQQAQLESYLSKVLDAVIRRDKTALRRFGQLDGFINNRIRKFVWACLLECSDCRYALYDDELHFPELDERDKVTIQQDVRRSFTRFPNLDKVRRAELEAKLECAIYKVLRIHPRLHYVQGFHDIAEVLILVVNDDDLSCKLLHRLSLFNIRDMLLPSLEPTLHSLDMIPAILQHVDKTLYRRVLKAVRPPHFAASPVMTWFSHDIDDIDKVATLFDFLLSSPPVMIFYLAAAVAPSNILLTKIILNSKPDILAPSDEDEDDFAVVYSRLLRVFRSQIPFTIVFPRAIRMLKDVPPEKLDVYRSLSTWSCYKYSGDVTSNWVEEGMELLRQATEEQYRVTNTETHTEITRREKTAFRQELADTAVKPHSRESEQMRDPNETLRKQMEIAIDEAIREETLKWKDMEERRAKAAAEEKEILRLAKESYHEKSVIDTDYGLTYWGIVIGGTAIAGAVIAIMKGYHYI